jgi:hypothetical protein
MGLRRLPRDPKEQRRWARRLSAKLIVPSLLLFAGPRESRGQFFRRIFLRAYQLGAEAGLKEVLAELERSDDPCQGLRPQYAKAAQAAARARNRKLAARSAERRGAPASRGAA